MINKKIKNFSYFNQKFLISNKEIKNGEKVFNFFIKGEYTLKNEYLLIFRGYLYENISNEKILEKIVENGINYVKFLNGYFCGVFYSHINNSFYIFTDKLGIFDIFYYIDGNTFFISNFFNEILRNNSFYPRDLDFQALFEFFLFEFPLSNKTFIKNIKFLPIGSIFHLDMNNNDLERISYSDYIFDINKKMRKKEVIKRLDKIFKIAIQNIKKINYNDVYYGLGLSGGMDSRLCAYFSKKANLKLRTFIIGQTNSDAYFIARKIAKKLNLNHYELGVNKYFYDYASKSIRYNPLMNVQYTWFYAIYNKLPKFDILLTGFHGDDQFGSHLRKSDKKIKKRRNLINRILDKYCELGYDDKIINNFKDSKYLFFKVLKEIDNFIITSNNKEFWQKIEEFNFKNRQRIYIKNNPSFNFLGKYDSFSIFLEPALIDFSMTIPFNKRLNQNIYNYYFKKKIPILYNIRPERKISLRFQNRVFRYILSTIYKFLACVKILNKFRNHKDIHKWLSGDKRFLNFLRENFLLNKNSVFDNIIQLEKIKKLINRNKWNQLEISIIFRLLTIKFFLDEFIL